MNTQNDYLSSATEREPSLMRGGPFYRAQRAVKLIRPNQWNIGRRVLFAIAVGWLPLLLITALFNPSGLVSLLRDYRVHSRMLIAVPVLLLGQALMESRFRSVVAYIMEADLLPTPHRARMDDIFAMLLRLRDSLIPELAIVILLIVHTATSVATYLDATPWIGKGAGADLHLTMAGWYAVLVSATMFQFLLGLSLWKWLMWTLFAFRFSRLNLKLVPTHPDQHGGLGFLGLTPIAFAPIAFAVTTVIGATWHDEILHMGANPMTFKQPAIALVVIVAAVALGPLTFFVPRLAALRRHGILEYGILGQINSTDYHEKWIHRRSGHEAEFLTAPESNALSGFGRNYQTIANLRPFPVDRGALIGLALSIAVPMLPVLLAVVPLAVVLKTLFRALR